MTTEDHIENHTDESGFVMREVEASDGIARLSFLVCEPLEEEGFLNAFSTRLGGVSPLPANALNLTHFKGDDRENVTENRRRFLKAINAAGVKVITARQTHSTTVVPVDSLDEVREAAPDGDAMTTKLRGVLLGIQTADCLPVMIADAQSGAMAAIHAGWRGTAGRITERAVASLMQQHGLNPRTAIAALGPTACAECYEVGEEVIERYKKEFGYWRKLFANFKEGGKAHLDVRAANIQQLAFCGFNADSIYVAPYCTMHQNEWFFSYRREARGQPQNVGRLLSVIGRL